MRTNLSFIVRLAIKFAPSYENGENFMHSIFPMARRVEESIFYIHKK